MAKILKQYQLSCQKYWECMNVNARYATQDI